MEFDPDGFVQNFKSVLRNSVPEIIPASSSKDASSEWQFPCPGDCARADLFYNHHTNSKIKFNDLWSHGQILQMVESDQHSWCQTDVDFFP